MMGFFCHDGELLNFQGVDIPAKMKYKSLNEILGHDFGSFRRFAEFFWIETFHHLRSELSPHQHPSREKSKYPGPLQLGIAILYNGLLSQHLSTTDTLPMGEPFNSPKVNLGAPSDSKKTITLLFAHNVTVRCFCSQTKAKR